MRRQYQCLTNISDQFHIFEILKPPKKDFQFFYAGSIIEKQGLTVHKTVTDRGTEICRQTEIEIEIKKRQKL